ncbi:tripartite motif-containing protein 2-like [Ptychodera flava]|uniref:tripartite motif-containing protein 2-like n=1 Tax=Ptychodera flava TaxID=63121 RepID=UPI003969D40E
MAEGSGKGALEKIGKDFLTCRLCLSYYKNAKSLPCLHSYCEGCLVTLVEKRGELVCPECRQRCDVPEGVSQLGTNFVLNGLIDFIKAQELCATDSGSETSLCESCEVNTVSYRCVNCAINICQSCRKCHASFPALRKHRLVAIGECQQTELDPGRVAAYKPARTCTVNGHEDNVLKLYCKSKQCQLPICLECMLLNHRPPEQETQYLTEKADEVRNQHEEKRTKLIAKAEEVRERLNTTLQELISAEKAYEEEVSEVKQRTETLIEKARKHEEMLLAELKEAYESLTKYLDCEVDRYELAEKNINSTAKYLDVFLNYGDAEEIVTDAKQTTVRMEELLALDLKHDRDIAFPCFQQVDEIDIKAILGQLRTASTSATTRSKIPKYAMVGETISIAVTTKDTRGLPTVTNQSLQAIKVTMEGLQRKTCQNVAIKDTAGPTHTIDVEMQEEGTQNISIAIGNASIPRSPFPVTVLSGESLVAEVRRTQVVRGKDWCWGHQDGNSTGYVRENLDNGYVTVNWHNGNTNSYGYGNTHEESTTSYSYYRKPSQSNTAGKNVFLKYRMGAEGKYDLKPAGYH